jgi:anti-sigma factor RsiW
MKCADTGFIQAFLDGECKDYDRERFISHMEQCAECRQQMEELLALEEWTQQTMEQGFFRPTVGER